MERGFKTVQTGGDFYEGPRWHEGRWWCSDFYTHRVQAIGSDGAAETIMEVEGQPSGLGWLPDGSLLVVSMTDHKVLRRTPDGEVSVHADLSDVCGGHLNDMVVDAQGRAYTGDFGFDLMGMGKPALGSLKRVDPDGTVTVVAEDLYFPNGAVITEDGGTLIVGETAGNRYTAFTIAEDGSLTDRRVHAQFAETSPLTETAEEFLGTLRVSPDGCALDAEGGIWFADALGFRCARIDASGEIVDEVRHPDGIGIYACALGGEDGKTLLMCCAPDFFEHNRVGKGEAQLVATTVDVPHAGRP
jgi:sugar lactone lactonase YvrE